VEIIDSHIHWGGSLALPGVEITTQELLRQGEESGVDRMVIFPFPSTAIADRQINETLLLEAETIDNFIPYYYIPDDLLPIPSEKGFYGGKWHWVRGVQDCSSNYDVLKDPGLGKFIEESEAIDLPLVFEEELAFTEAFVKMTNTLKIIVPHMGMLGGSPLDFLQAFKDRTNVYFDTSLASPQTVIEFEGKIGSERILFGSDIPFGTMKREVEKVLSLPLGDEKKEQICSGNIKRLTGLA
jgi:predicted TIM-barrel fold metal-dependent hydrolase